METIEIRRVKEILWSRGNRLEISLKVRYDKIEEKLWKSRNFTKSENRNEKIKIQNKTQEGARFSRKWAGQNEQMEWMRDYYSDRWKNWRIVFNNFEIRPLPPK